VSANDELAHSDAWNACPADRWQRVWSHREQLLRVARRRSTSMEEAEDAVHEAMVRAAERAHVDGDRLGAWLTTVTVRLCVDRFRQINREAEVHTRSVLTAAPNQVTVEEAVCDRAEAKWLADRSGDLPARQAEALCLQAKGLDLPQIAQRMELSYRAVQSLLARARKTLRATLAGTLAIFVWSWRGRPRVGVGAQTTILVSAAATLAIAGLSLPTHSEAEEAPTPQFRPYESPSSTAPDRVSNRIPRPTASRISADPGGGLVPSTRQPASGPPTDAGSVLSDSGAAAPSGPPDTALPALPALPDTPLPALPTPPDVPTFVQPAEVDGTLTGLPGGHPATDVRLPQP